MYQLIVLLLGVTYVGGIVKFLQGFRRTNFNSGIVNKLKLSLLWPVLLLISGSYRRNFQKALKG
jgi:cell shape-determining protein MreD